MYSCTWLQISAPAALIKCRLGAPPYFILCVVMHPRFGLTCAMSMTF